MTALRRIENAPGYQQARWLFRCDCGAEKELFGYSVAHGKVVSCGCWREDHPAHLTHGLSASREWQSWQSMRQRCQNPKSKVYPHYGGRGISVCSEWSDFAVFFRDMGPRPEGTSLERKDNSLGYSPSNCVWAAPIAQVRNRRTTTFYEFGGANLPLQVWAEQRGIPYQTLWHRHKVGKRGEELLAPVTRGGGRPRSNKT